MQQSSNSSEGKSLTSLWAMAVHLRITMRLIRAYLPGICSRRALFSNHGKVEHNYSTALQTPLSSIRMQTTKLPVNKRIKAVRKIFWLPRTTQKSFKMIQSSSKLWSKKVFTTDVQVTTRNWPWSFCRVHLKNQCLVSSHLEIRWPKLELVSPHSGTIQRNGSRQETILRPKCSRIWPNLSTIAMAKRWAQLN